MSSASAKLSAVFWAILMTVILAALIVLGSRNLHDFDAAMVGYTFATLVIPQVFVYVALAAWALVLLGCFRNLVNRVVFSPDVPQSTS
jgi:hypothetical protein